ncbi:MAG TPA: MFS transporter [Chitinophaga sp.]
MSQQRATRIAVSSLFFLTGLCFLSWASRIPAIQEKLDLSEGGLGLVLLALPIGSWISMPVAGFLVNRLGSRQVVLVAGLVYAMILPLLGVVTAAWQLVGVLVLFGFIGNVANIAVNTQAVAVEVMYGRTIMASFHGLWSTGGLTGSLIGMFMEGQHVEPYQHFLLITLMAAVIVAASTKYVAAHDVNKQEGKTKFTMPDRLLLILGVIAFCSMICEGAMFDWSGVYFKKVIHAPAIIIGAGSVAFMSTMALFRFIADWLTIRYGTKRVLQLSGAVTAVGLLIAVLLPYLPTAVLGFLMVGAGVSSVVPLVYSAAGKSDKLSPGAALATVSTIGYLGFLCGPPIIGLIAQVSSLSISFSVIAIMGACIAVMGSRAKV